MLLPLKKRWLPCFLLGDQCSKLSNRCKPCTTSYKLVMCVILEWVLVTPGNVSKLPIFELKFQVLTSFVFSPCYAKYIFAAVYALNVAHTALLDYAINNKLTPFISMQNHYNLLYREEEREVFPTLKVGWYMCFADSRLHYWTLSQYFGVGSIPWSPLARGLLTRSLIGQTTRGESDGYGNPLKIPHLC